MIKFGYFAASKNISALRVGLRRTTEQKVVAAFGKTLAAATVNNR